VTTPAFIDAVRTRLERAGWSQEGPRDRVDHVLARDTVTFRLRALPDSPRLFLDVRGADGEARIAIMGDDAARSAAVDEIVAHQGTLEADTWKSLGAHLLAGRVQIASLSPNRENETPVRDVEAFVDALIPDDEPDLEAEPIDFSDESLWPSEDELDDDDDIDADEAADA
jgi:hypothetical protein